MAGRFISHWQRYSDLTRFYADLGCGGYGRGQKRELGKAVVGQEALGRVLVDFRERANQKIDRRAVSHEVADCVVDRGG